MTATVTRDTFEAFRIRNAGEYATICVRAWTRAAEPKRSPGYCGEILIHSSYGDWAEQWGACGMPFPRFLASISFDYLFSKLMPHTLERFDGYKTQAALRKKVTNARRKRSIGSKDARELWQAIEDAQVRHTQTTTEFVLRMGDASRDFPEFFEEPWYLEETRTDSGAVGFWRDIWPHFIAAYTEKEAQSA